MAYCDIDDVRKHNPKVTYDVNSVPSGKQVESMIDDVAAELDTILRSRGVSVPVTTPADFLAHIKYVNSIGAAALAELAMFHAPAGTISDGHGNELWEIYVAARESLRANPLPTEVYTESVSARSMPESYFQRNPAADGYDATLGKERVY